MFQFFYIIFLIIFGSKLVECFDVDAWRSYEKTFTNENREELVISNVTTDDSFKSDLKVKKWSSLNVGPICYTAGLMDTKLIILFTTLDTNGTKFNITSKTFELNETVTGALWYNEWRNEENYVMLILATLQEAKLVWYRIKDYDLVGFWSWPLKDRVMHMDIMKINGKNIFAILQKNGIDQMVAEFYEFQLNSVQDYRFLHRIHLSSPCKSFAVNNFKFDYYLSFPQKSTSSVLVYKYSKNEFILHENVSSSEVDNVIPFEDDFKSFLIFDGPNPSIYQFTKNGLVKITSKINFNGVHFWLPVPVNSYRDQMILVVQRVLDHGTHESFDVDVITYNGNKFEEHEDIPCNYFGETVQGLNCMTQHDLKTGIIGTTYISVDDKIGLLVPRTDGHSVLFMVQNDVRVMPHPKEDELTKLLILKEKLQAMLDTQERQREEIKNRTTLQSSSLRLSTTMSSEDHSSSDEKSTSATPSIVQYKQVIQEMVHDMDAIKAKVDALANLWNGTMLEVITINGDVKIEGMSEFEEVEVKTVKDENATNLLNDIVRKNNISRVLGPKIFMDLSAEHIKFENINGISSDDIVTLTDHVLLNGNITFSSPVHVSNLHIVSGLINDIDMENEIVDVRKNFEGSLHFENMDVKNNLQIEKLNGVEPFTQTNDQLDDVRSKTIFFPGNATIENINGENFNEFISKLCLVNVKCYIPHLKVNGNITIDNDSVVKNLNGLMFPEEYLLSEQRHMVNITGRKIFTNNLSAQKILINGTLDDISTENLIPLSSNQQIPEKVIFEDLEVTEELKVGGKIKGKYLDKFLPNLTLMNTRNIKSNTYFENLEVEGSIIIENNFNGVNFTKTLEDIVYKDEEVVVIEAKKHFPESLTVRNNLQVESNSFNNVPFESLVTKNTEQILSIHTLNGKVSIDNLYTNGLFDGKNITQLDKEIVRINADHNISSTLIFTEEIESEHLMITQKLNDLTSDDYLFTSGDRIISDNLTFENIQVENLFVEGDYFGEISGFDLEDFSKKVLSYTQEQQITGDYVIKESNVDIINPLRINGVDFEDIFDLQFSKNVMELLREGEITFQTLDVNGSIDISSINGQNLQPYLDKNSYLKFHNAGAEKELTIQGNVYFDSLEIQKLSGVPFDEFIAKLIFKDEENVHINGTITFLNGIKVKKLIETEKLNGIYLENILKKEANQIIRCPVTIHGNVTLANDVEILDTINDISIDYIKDSINVTSDPKTGVYKGDMMFSRLAHIKNLSVDGLVNNENWKELTDNIVYVNEDCNLPKDVSFENTVDIQGNLAVTGNISNVDLSEYVPRIVWITKDKYIDGPVKFTNSIVIHNHLTVDDLDTKLLNENDFERFIERAVYIDRGMLSGNYTFEEALINESLTTKFLNDVDMDNIIPLRSDQIVDHLEFEEIVAVNGITVGNLVNGIYLQEEYNKTVMRHLDQEISSNIVFLNNVLIRENLVSPKINNIPADKIVTSDTDQNLTAIYSFGSKNTIDSNLYIHNHINGINLTNWIKNSFKIYSEEIQNVDEDWFITNELTFQENVDGDGFVSGMNLEQVAQEVEKKKNYVYQIQRGIIDDYTNMCKDVTYLYESAKKQIYKFQYFEELQEFSLQNAIQQVGYFQHGDNHYLLITEDDCHSHLMKFYETSFYPVRKLETGRILQSVSVFDNGLKFLVTRDDADGEKFCNISGTNVWEFDNDNLKFMSKVEDQELLQESLVPNTFYGIAKNVVTEFKIDVSLQEASRYRFWKTNEKNLKFIPRGLETGLALTTGHMIIYLHRNESTEEAGFDNNYESVIRGETSERSNHIMPGKNGGDSAVINVGIQSTRKTLLAVATHRETSVKDHLDLIEIYGDPLIGEMFQKLPTYKPSNLLSVELNNAETLLVFMENEQILQVYEYKGIEGFRHRLSARLEGQHLFLMTLPIKPYKNERKVIGIVNNNKVRLVEAVMVGNQIRDDLNCEL